MDKICGILTHSLHNRPLTVFLYFPTIDYISFNIFNYQKLNRRLFLSKLTYYWMILILGMYLGNFWCGCPLCPPNVARPAWLVCHMFVIYIFINYPLLFHYLIKFITIGLKIVINQNIIQNCLISLLHSNAAHRTSAHKRV